MTNEEYYNQLDEKSASEIDARQDEILLEIQDKSIEWKSDTTGHSYYIMSLSIMEHRISKLELRDGINELLKENKVKCPVCNAKRDNNNKPCECGYLLEGEKEQNEKPN